MKDDAFYTEHPGGVETAYIAYWQHRRLMWRQRQTIRRLIAAMAVMAVAIVILIIKGA